MLTAKQMIKAVTETRGNVTDACAKLQCSRDNFYRYLKRYPTVKRIIDELREARHEHVVGKFMDAIDSGNVTAMIFYLKTQCGWKETERYEVTGGDGEPLIPRDVILALDKIYGNEN